MNDALQLTLTLAELEELVEAVRESRVLVSTGLLTKLDQLVGDACAGM